QRHEGTAGLLLGNGGARPRIAHGDLGLRDDAGEGQEEGGEAREGLARDRRAGMESLGHDVLLETVNTGRPRRGHEVRPVPACRASRRPGPSQQARGGLRASMERRPPGWPGEAATAAVPRAIPAGSAGSVAAVGGKGTSGWAAPGQQHWPRRSWPPGCAGMPDSPGAQSTPAAICRARTPAVAARIDTEPAALATSVARNSVASARTSRLAERIRTGWIMA